MLSCPLSTVFTNNLEKEEKIKYHSVFPFVSSLEDAIIAMLMFTTADNLLHYVQNASKLLFWIASSLELKTHREII